MVKIGGFLVSGLNLQPDTCTRISAGTDPLFHYYALDDAVEKRNNKSFLMILVYTLGVRF